MRSQEEEIHNLQEQIAAACLKVFNNNNNIMDLSDEVESESGLHL